MYFGAGQLIGIAFPFKPIVRHIDVTTLNTPIWNWLRGILAPHPSSSLPEDYALLRLSY
jgi:hypothetical protein